jgi:hypothetical protein
MDNLTPESAAVRLFKATLPKATLEECAFILHHHSDLEDRWNLVGSEHERICSERIAAAIAAMDGWQLIDDDTPFEQDFLLGWFDNFPKMRWQMEVGCVGRSSTVASPYSNGWRHGQATHFRYLAAPPQHGGENG